MLLALGLICAGGLLYGWRDGECGRDGDCVYVPRQRFEHLVIVDIFLAVPNTLLLSLDPPRRHNVSFLLAVTGRGLLSWSTYPALSEMPSICQVRDWYAQSFELISATKPQLA